MMRFPGGRINHSFNPPKTVGTGWAGGYKDVMPMGQLGIYAMQDDGTLRWQWHRGALDGSFNWVEPSQKPKDI